MIQYLITAGILLGAYLLYIMITNPSAGFKILYNIFYVLSLVLMGILRAFAAIVGFIIGLFRRKK